MQLVHGLFLFPVSSVLETNQPANSLQGWGRDAGTEEKTRRNTAAVKHDERLGDQQVSGYEQISQRRPFQEGTNERGRLSSHGPTRLR